MRLFSLNEEILLNCQKYYFGNKYFDINLEAVMFKLICTYDVEQA